MTNLALKLLSGQTMKPKENRKLIMLLVKLDDTGFKAATYKRGLATLEDQIIKYREHEVLFSEEIALLKRSVGHKEYQMGLLRAELEKVKQEKEGFEFKIAKFDKSAKDLEQLLGSQITDNSKKGLGYSAVPPPHPLILNRPTPLDLSYSGLDEFKEPEFKGYGPENSKKESNVVCENSSNETKKNSDAPIIEEWVSDNEDEVESPVVFNAAIIPKDAHNAVKRNRFNAVKASACWVWMPKNRVVDHVSKNISASVTLKRLDYIDAQGRFKSVMAWMDAQIQGRQECSKEKEESREECSKSRKTKKMKCLEESSQQRK
ncbi:hypothetical protein Tco_0966228 [Tanacetum coccineum]